MPLFILWLLDHQLYSHTTSCNLVLLACLVMTPSQPPPPPPRSLSLSLFILSTCLLSLQVGAFTVPLFILWLLDHQLYSHTTSCNLVLLTCFFVMAASQLNVVVVTVERYTAVCHPFLHRRLLASRPELVTVTIALVWVVSLVSAALSSLAIDSRNSACSYYDHFQRAFLLAVVVVGVFLPFAVIVALNVKMLVKVRSSRLFKRDMGQSQPPPPSSSSARPLRRGSSGARVVSKATTMVMTVCCLFLLAWTPFFVVILCHSFCPSCRLRQALDLILLFAFANSAWNPVVYALCNLMFRRAYRHVLTLRRCWAQASVTLGGEAVRKGSGSSIPRLGSTGGSL